MKAQALERFVGAVQDYCLAAVWLAGCRTGLSSIPGSLPLGCPWEQTKLLYVWTI